MACCTLYDQFLQYKNEKKIVKTEDYNVDSTTKTIRFVSKIAPSNELTIFSCAVVGSSEDRTNET